MIFIDAAFRKSTPYTPVWLMRQAGRYLSEYKVTRAKAGNFLDLCKNAELACEVTLQPVDILNVDAAILFSDILVVPLEMGLKLDFVKGEGPIFYDKIKSAQDVKNLASNISKKLNYVYDAISLTRKKLARDKALIGFCGSPWTLATYMIEGKGSKAYTASKHMLYTNPRLLHELLAKLSDELLDYLRGQIRAGVNAVQIFDSWASALEESAYLEFSWKYIKSITHTLKVEFPNIPLLVFPKGVGSFLDRLDGEFDVFSIDWSTPLELAKEKLGSKYVLQGNLEPARLYSSKAMSEGVEHIIRIMGKKEGHIFNLGHGMIEDLPRENAINLIKMVHEKTKR